MFKYFKFEKVETEYTTLAFRGDAEGVKVNHFDVDVVSIESDNEDAIDALVTSQAVECVEITQDEFKALVKSSAQVLRIRAVVKASVDNDMKSIIEQYPLIERETWSIQYEEATKYLDSSDDTDAPFLKILADADGNSLDDFANAVIAKKDAFVAFSANVFAKKRAFEKKLLAEIGY